MFDRFSDLVFSDKAKRVFDKACGESRRRGESTLRSATVVYAFYLEGDCTATHLLRQLGIQKAGILDRLNEMYPIGTPLAVDEPVKLGDEVPLLFDCARNQSVAFRNPQVSTEHLLLATIALDGSSGQLLLSRALSDVEYCLRDCLNATYEFLGLVPPQ